jgi:predicted ATPase
MIRSARIKNFKCFVDSTIHLRNLTVLCGKNSAGKSSAIQAILLSRQAATSKTRSNTVTLNGEHELFLGTVADILCRNSSWGDVQFEFACDDGGFLVSFESGPKYQGSRFLQIKDTAWIAPPRPFSLQEGLGFTYLCADRLGPRSNLAIQSIPKQDLRIGSRGEFVAQVIYESERDTIHRQRLCPTSIHGESANMLARHQIELWLSEILDVEISVHAFVDANANMSFLRIGKGAKQLIEPERPHNVGFSVSYVLPIVVSALLASENGLLIVENPESHLHPLGQSRIGQFLATIAASGLQVIIETHSDHVLNGIRLAVKNERISHDRVGICFLERASREVDIDHETQAPIIRDLEIEKSGVIREWPTGFFDQIAHDLERLWQ